MTSTTTEYAHEVDAIAAADLRIRRAEEHAAELAASAPHRTEGVRRQYRHLVAEYLAMRAENNAGAYRPASLTVGKLIEGLGIRFADLLDEELRTEWWPTA